MRWTRSRRTIRNARRRRERCINPFLFYWFVDLIHQWFVNLVADLLELLELSRVARDFALKFRPHWPGWMSCWVPPICPKVGYKWFPYHPQPLWVLLVTAWNAVSKKLATHGNFLQEGVTRSCTSLHKVVKPWATLGNFYGKILMNIAVISRPYSVAIQTLTSRSQEPLRERYLDI